MSITFGQRWVDIVQTSHVYWSDMSLFCLCYVTGSLFSTVELSLIVNG